MRPQVGHLPKGTPDLLRGQERLFLPYNARGWEVLPLSFVRGDYWIHFEVDSITLRGEAEVIDAMFARPPYLAAVECISFHRLGRGDPLLVERRLGLSREPSQRHLRCGGCGLGCAAGAEGGRVRRRTICGHPAQLRFLHQLVHLPEPEIGRDQDMI